MAFEHRPAVLHVPKTHNFFPRSSFSGWKILDAHQASGLTPQALVSRETLISILI
jgi:hypothetical protein